MRAFKATKQQHTENEWVPDLCAGKELSAQRKSEGKSLALLPFPIKPRTRVLGVSESLTPGKLGNGRMSQKKTPAEV